MRYVFLAAFAAVSLFGQSVSPKLSITNYQVVTQEPASPGSWRVTYRADLVNSGEALAAFKATVSSVDSTGVQTVAGQDVLNFDSVPAGAQVTSTDTFTVLVSRTHRFHPSNLHWSFEPAAAARQINAASPVSRAGFGQTVKAGSLVNLNGGRSTIPNGSGRLTYNWMFTSRPAGSAATLTDPTSARPSFVADVPGDYTLALTVSNGSASSRSAVTISTTNSAPLADAGRSRTMAVGSSVRLNAGASTDVDGDALTYSWRLISKPADSTATLVGANTVTPSFVIDQAGAYTAQLITNDGRADSRPSTVTISTQNTQPVADAGSDQVVPASALVQLDGSGTTDVDGDSLTYSWTLISVPGGSSATLSDPTAVNPTFIADVAGSYIAQLVVSDGSATSGPTTVIISTDGVQSPIAAAGLNQTVNHNSTVQLSGSATDPQGLPVTNQWSLISVPPGSKAVLSSSSDSNPTFLADQPGIYVAQLMVSDGVKTSTPSTVVITTTNTAPVANPGRNMTVATGRPVTLNGGRSLDADNDPLTHSWTFLSRPADSTATLTNANTASPAFVPDQPGTYVLQQIVNDGFTDSNPATVTVSTPAQPALTLTPASQSLAPDSQGTLVVSLPSAATGGDVVVSLLNSSGCFPGSCVAELPPSGTVTIRQGFFGATIPVRGHDIGTTSITAVASGYQPAKAVVNVVAPTITIMLASPAVGFGSTVMGTVTLSAPAGVEGVPVDLKATSGVTIDPTTVTIPIGSATGTFTVTGGFSPTTAKITASASGYPSASTSVQVGSRGQIVLQSGVTVGTGQSVPLTVSLATFTGSDVVINLASSDTSKVTISPSTVTILAQHNTPLTQPVVTGVDFGSANITATASGYIGTSTVVTVNGALSFTKTTVAVGAGGTQNLTLNLASPAPAEGLVVNLKSSNKSVATVPDTVTIAAGTLSVTVPATGVSPGFANISATTTAPNVTGANATVNVVNAGTIILPANVTVGPGQSVAFPVTVSPAAPAGGVTITLASSNNAIATISPSTITIAPGQNASQTIPQVTGVDFGIVTITATANGYTGGSQNVTVGATFSLTPQTSTLAPGASENLTLTLSAAAPANLPVTLTSSAPGVASVTNVTIPAGAQSVMVPVTAVSAGGPAVITASAPGIASTSASVTVSTTGAINFPSSVAVAAGGSVQVPISLSAPAPQPGVTITLTSNNPGIATVSPPAIFFGPNQQTTNLQVTVNGVAPGLTSITASAPNYASASMAVTVQAPNTIGLAPPTLILAAGAVQTLTLTLSTPAPAGGLSVHLASSNSSVASVPDTFPIPPNATTAQVPVTANTAGTATITATAPGVAGTGMSMITVVFGSLTVSCPTVAPSQTVGCTVMLSAIPRGPVTVALTSDNPSVISAAPTVVIPSGATSTNQALITGVSFGTANITAAASGWTSGQTQATVAASVSFAPKTLSMRQGTTQSLTLTLSGPAPAGGVTVDLSSDNTNAATVPPTATFAAGANTTLVPVTGVGLGQATIHASKLPSIGDATALVTVSSLPDIILPAGVTVAPNQSAPFSVTLKNPAPQSLFVLLTTSDPNIVTLNHGKTTANVFFLQGQTTPVSQPVVDGVNFGSATITGADAGLEGLSGDTETVTVAGSVSFFPASIMLAPGGSQRVALTLTPAAPTGGLTVNLSSDNPSVANTILPTVFFPQGSSSISVAINGLTGGTTLIHANAPNVPDATLSVTVGTPGVNLPANVTVAPGQSVPFPIMISPAAPSGGVTVSLSTNDPTIATISPSAFIQEGQVSPATQPQLTGVNFGTTTVTGTAPGYGSAIQSVKVGSALAFTPPNTSLLAGATGNLTLTLSSPAPANGLSINLVSSNSGVATVAGPVVINAGETSVQVPVTGVNAGQAVITASTNSPNVSSANATVTVGACVSNCGGSGPPTPLMITTTALPAVEQGKPYSAPLAATGGTMPYFFNASALPSGLMVVGNQIVGTTSLAPSSRNVTISVTDSSSPAMSQQARLILTIVPPGTTQPLAVATSSLPSGNVGSPYSAPLSATGGSGTYTFSASGLPAGLSVAGTQITGTPQAPCTPCSVTISVTDTATPQNSASKVVSLTINPPTLQITIGSLPGGTSNQPYSATLNATGGTQPYTWMATGLPNGLTVSGNMITGTTAATCSPCNVTITVKDSANPQNTATTLLPLNITGQLTLNTSSLPGGTQNAPYTAQLSASGGTGALTFSAQGLPAGLNVIGNQITGTPLVPFNSPVTVTVNDSAAPPNIVQKALQLTINPQLALSTNSLPTGTVNTPYTANLSATGGAQPYTFSATGLPNGLTVAGNQITGTPTVGFNGPVTVKVTDSSTPANNAQSNLTLVINAPLSIPTSSLNNGTVGQPYSTTLAAVGGMSPYTFSATGLPNGLGVSGNQITGTPTVACNPCSVTIMAVDSANPQGSVQKTLPLTITLTPLSVTTSALNGGTAGQAYSTTLAATGGQAPYTFSATGLPSGLSVSGNQITGTTATGCNPNPCSVTITVMDSASPQNTASKPLSLNIAAPMMTLAITAPASLPNGMVGSSYPSVNLTATGGTAPYFWAASGLPAGLNVSGSQIVGTPTQAVSKNVIIQVTDSATPSNKASVNLPIVIAPQGGPDGKCTPIMITNTSVGQNLQTLTTVTLGVPPVRNASVDLMTTDPSKVLVALRQTQTGAASLTGPNAPFIPAGSSSSQLFVQGVAQGSANLTAMLDDPTIRPIDTTNGVNPPPPYCTSNTGVINVTPSGFVLSGPNGMGSSFVTFAGSSTPLIVSAARLDANNNFVQVQQLSANQSASVNIASTNPAAGSVNPASVVFTPGVDTVITQVPPCSNVGSTCFTAANVTVDTTTTLSATAPAGFSTPANGANSLGVDVEPPGLMNPSSVTVGNGLETSATVTLNGTAPSSTTCTDPISNQTIPGVTIVLTTNSQNIQLSTTSTGPGSSSIIACVAVGRSTTRPFFIYGGANSGTATYTATASSGFGTATGNVTLAPAGVAIAGPQGVPGSGFTTTQGQPSNLTISTGFLDNFGNFIAEQNVAGGNNVNVNVLSSDTNVGTVNPTMVTIPAASSEATSTFTAVSAGSTNLTVDVPQGFSTTSAHTLTATVQQPSFAIVDNVVIGQNLETKATLTAGLPAPANGLIVTISSNNPNLLISSSPTAAGMQSIQITIPANAKTATYYLQSVASAGTAGYSVSAPGFATRTASNITFGRSGFVIVGPNGLIGGNTNALIQKGTTVGLTISPAVLDANNLVLGTEQLAGGQPSATVVASLSGVGTLNPTMVVIPAGSAGVDTLYFAAAVGHATVSITQPSGFTKPAGVKGSPPPNSFPPGPDPTTVNISVTP